MVQIRLKLGLPFRLRLRLRIRFRMRLAYTDIAQVGDRFPKRVPAGCEFEEGEGG